MSTVFATVLALTATGAVSSVAFFVAGVEAMRPDRARVLRLTLAATFLVFLLTAFGCLVAAIRLFDGAA